MKIDEIHTNIDPDKKTENPDKELETELDKKNLLSDDKYTLEDGSLDMDAFLKDHLEDYESDEEKEKKEEKEEYILEDGSFDMGKFLEDVLGEGNEKKDNPDDNGGDIKEPRERDLPKELHEQEEQEKKKPKKEIDDDWER